ncbi:MAG: LLM class flavin-dependent oxidoreductase [Streptosporangiales bacterium]|nr:LLM class flavin-dependent oxidoreductase [Streptosporangiales bacterium]
MSRTGPESLHLAVALDGAGWHPAAFQEPGSRTDELFTAGYWADLAREAEAGLLDFLTIEDSLGLRPWGGVTPGRNGSRSGDVQGRLDAVLTAARIAPLTSHIGIIPAAVVTHTEPFHVSTAIATLDYASEGRAGVRLRVSRDEARHFGRRADLGQHSPAVTRGTPEAQRLTARLFDEAADYAEVLRRLWDSWEDDAVIRDVPAGRFIDRGKLHYIDFEGEWFSVRGPSITPRPPQGQPVIAVLAHADVPFRLAARSADIAFVTPHGPDEAAGIITKINSHSAERTLDPVRVYADLTVFIDETPGTAAARRARLDEAAGAAYRSDTEIVAGTPTEIADLLLSWSGSPDAGLAGFRLRPGTLPYDLSGITRGLVPELQRRGVFRTSYAESDLRSRLGLDPHPANRYASSEAASA